MLRSLFVVCLMLIHLSVHAESRLATYCDEDPSGELYSSAWDSDPYDFLKEIGLPDPKYRSLIDNVDSTGAEINSFRGYVKFLKKDYPEIDYSYRIWKLKTCINDGYNELHR